MTCYSAVLFYTITCTLLLSLRTSVPNVYVHVYYIRPVAINLVALYIHSVLYEHKSTHTAQSTIYTRSKRPVYCVFTHITVIQSCESWPRQSYLTKSHACFALSRAIPTKSSRNSMNLQITSKIFALSHLFFFVWSPSIWFSVSKSCWSYPFKRKICFTINLHHNSQCFLIV